LLQGLKGNAQITLEHNFTATIEALRADLQGIYLSHSGFKFALWNESDTLLLYNLNLSLYKTIVVPGYAYNIESISWLSEGLFNTDTSHIAYLVQYGLSFSDSIKIYDETGNILFQIDTAEQIYDQLGFVGTAVPAIFPTDSGTFMMLESFNKSTGYISSFLTYRLPGALPCIPGCSGNSLSYSPVLKKPGYGLSLSPNPAVSYTNIYYTLPAGVSTGEIVLYDLTGRKINTNTVSSRIDHIRLTTSDLKAGTYLYQLVVEGQENVSAKKLVVIK
jgi:hypothetical protein